MDTLKHGNKEKLLFTCKPNQCLGSGSESVGSARFWLPGSGSAKIRGSTDPDPKGKISTKNCKKIFLLLKLKSELLKKREIIKKNFVVHKV